MPYAAKRPCCASGCRALVDKGYCADHQHLAPKQLIERQRGNSSQRGYGYKWQVARKRHLVEHPLCVECESNGIVKAADVVDHIIPHKGDQQLFWDESNWQSLCSTCHNRKTATQDSNFAHSRGWSNV